MNDYIIHLGSGETLKQSASYYKIEYDFVTFYNISEPIVSVKAENIIRIIQDNEEN